MVMAHAGCDPVLQLFQHDGGDAWDIELARVGDWHPDHFDQFRLDADKALVAAHDPIEVGGKKAAVEAARTARRGDGTADEMRGAEVGDDAGFGEGLPGLGWRW